MPLIFPVLLLCSPLFAAALDLDGLRIRRPEDIYRTDEKIRELMSHDSHLLNWLKMAKKHIHFQGYLLVFAG